MTHYDVVMIGAGIVGLATARELHSRHPRLRIAVLDKESSPGQHQSAHNSGVLHAGVYYKPGSLKARLCVAGKVLMERFAEEHDIRVDRCGKLIVALDEQELEPLAELEARGHANGVPGLRMLGPEELREVEPHAAGIRALHSPGTGIIDFGQVVARAGVGPAAEGVDLLMGHEVLEIQRRGDSVGAAHQQWRGHRAGGCSAARVCTPTRWPECQGLRPSRSCRSVATTTRCGQRPGTCAAV